MLKGCSPSFYKPLDIIINQFIETGVFPPEWKKGIYKKGEKQILKNYRPVSLLPICGKILKRLMFNEMSQFFIENKLFSSSQSGFKPGDSSINQLLSITHEIYNSLVKVLKLEALSLISQRHLHDGIISKLTQNGTSGNLLNLLHDFLNERKQRVVLNE